MSGFVYQVRLPDGNAALDPFEEKVKCPLGIVFDVLSTGYFPAPRAVKSVNPDRLYLSIVYV